MTPRTSPRPTGTRRPRSVAVLLAVLAAVALSLVPGSASATGRITPLADCYADNGNGTYTVVLGYRNNTNQTITIAAGPENTFSPAKYNSSLPTTFKPGEQHGVAKVTITGAELNSGPSWYVDGTKLSTNNAGSTPQCSASQLPMLANGAAVVAMVLLAGAVGVVVVRRQRRVTVAARA